MMELGRGLQSGAAPLQHYLQRVQLLIQADNMTEASRISAEATDAGLLHPNLLALAAYHHLNSGDGARAIDLATRATEIAPENVNALHSLGSCLAKLGRCRDAVGVFDAALSKWPNAFMVHFSRGMALEQLGEMQEARAAYERTVELQPRHSAALARLAYHAAQRGGAERARAYGDRALSIDARQAYASLALAMADLHEGKFEAARERTAAMLSRPNLQPSTRATALSIAGDALDGTNAFADAFAAYREAGEILQRAHAPILEEEPALARAQRLTRFMERTPADCWKTNGAVESPAGQHVFLVSFPRSGTTLLGQVLAASPDIEVLDESDCLLDSYHLLASDAALEELVAKSSVELEGERAAYWRRVREAGVRLDRAAFVDKMPLNSVVLCLIAKLFPDAKILVAVRDPRDVVFSSFRRRFSMTPQMYELLTPQGAATYYDAVMSLVEIYRNRLPLEFFDAKYERLVSDSENETARLCRYIGVEYHPGMGDFAGRAELDAINTPSVVQVARGLYVEGVGHWRHYREQLRPQLALLAPWVNSFDYEGN